MPGNATSSAPGIALAVATPARNGTSGSFLPWITTGGHVEPAQRRCAGARGEDGCELPRRPRRVVAAVVCGRCLLADALLVQWVAGRADHPKHAHEVVDVGIAALRRAPHQDAPHAQLRRADAPVAGRGEHRAEREHPLRVTDGHRLGDHPAHRDAGHVRALDAEVVEQAEAVARHVVQQVGRADPEASHRAHHVRHGCVDLRGEARVAVVEADHVEPALGEPLAELAIPVDELHPEPHHEQERGVGAVADRLVDELDLSDVCALFGHRPGISTRSFESRTEKSKLLVRRKLGSFPSSSSLAVCPLAKRQPLPKSWNTILPRWLSRRR